MLLNEFQGIVTIGPFLSAIGTTIMAFMTYKKIKEDRLMKNVDIHNKDLKEFLNKWKNYLPTIVSAESLFNCYENIKIIDPPELSIHDENEKFDIEEYPFFEDLRFHLPINHKDLFNDFDNFKRKIIKYDNYRYNLCKDIKEHIQSRDRKLLPESIFSSAISQTKGRSLNIYVENKKLIYKIGKEELPIRVMEDEGKIDNIKGEFYRVSDEYRSLYKEKIDLIILYENELNDLRGKLFKIIDELCLTPILQNMTCRYIKNSFK